MLELTFYTRSDCELCSEMESIINAELSRLDAHLSRVLIDHQPDLEAQFGVEVPVLFVNGRKAFKYRCTSKELRKRLLRETHE